jgi:hypothetical protein
VTNSEAKASAATGLVRAKQLVAVNPPCVRLHAGHLVAERSLLAFVQKLCLSMFAKNKSTEEVVLVDMLPFILV